MHLHHRIQIVWLQFNPFCDEYVICAFFHLIFMFFVLAEFIVRQNVEFCVNLHVYDLKWYTIVPKFDDRIRVQAGHLKQYLKQNLMLWYSFL